MAIREKLRAKFGRNKPSSGDSTPSSASTEGHYTGRKDIEYYKPHEIPKSKYRGKVDKAHQETLDSYSFVDAFQTIKRKTSTAFSGTFSPGGTKAQSAAASRVQSAAVSRRTSWMSRQGSVASSAGGSAQSDDKHRRKSVQAIKPPNVRNISENSDDDTDVANTGLSRIGTIKDTPNFKPNDNVPTIRLDRQATAPEKLPPRNNSPTHTIPFTPEELERAMTKVTMVEHLSMRRGSIAAH